jgi:hypothetical protein
MHIATRTIPALALTLLLAGAATAGNCPGHVMRQGTRYTRDTLRLLQHCEVQIRNGQIPPNVCRIEPGTMQLMQRSISRFREKLRKKCAGRTPAQIPGFPSTDCPTSTTLNDLIECLMRVLDARVDDLIEAEFGCVGRCGDAIANLACGEACDATDLGGGTCVGLGFAGGGVLGCTATCTHDTSLCVP